MDNKPKLTFGKSVKLCSETRISQLFRDGGVIFNHPLKVNYLPGKSTHSRVVISVPKRSFKKAVDRNFIKRKIREAIRALGFPDYIENSYDISVVYIGKEMPQTAPLNQKVKDVLDKIKKECSNNTLSSVHTAD